MIQQEQVDSRIKLTSSVRIKLSGVTKEGFFRNMVWNTGTNYHSVISIFKRFIETCCIRATVGICCYALTCSCINQFLYIRFILKIRKIRQSLTKYICCFIFQSILSTKCLIVHIVRVYYLHLLIQCRQQRIELGNPRFGIASSHTELEDCSCYNAVGKREYFEIILIVITRPPFMGILILNRFPNAATKLLI